MPGPRSMRLEAVSSILTPVLLLAACPGDQRGGPVPDSGPIPRDAAAPDGTASDGTVPLVPGTTTEGTVDEVGGTTVFLRLDRDAPPANRDIFGLNLLVPASCLDGSLPNCQVLSPPEAALDSRSVRLDVSEASLLAALRPTVVRLAAGTTAHCMRWHDDSLPPTAARCEPSGSQCSPPCGQHQVCTSSGCRFRGSCSPACGQGEVCVLENCDFDPAGCDVRNDQMLSPTVACVRWNRVTLEAFLRYASALADPGRPLQAILTLNIRDEFGGPASQAAMASFAHSVDLARDLRLVFELGNEPDIGPLLYAPEEWLRQATRYADAIRNLGLDPVPLFAGPATTYDASPLGSDAPRDGRAHTKEEYVAYLLGQGHFPFETYDFHHYPYLMTPEELLSQPALHSLESDLEFISEAGYQGPIALTEAGPTGSGAGTAWGTWAEALWLAANLIGGAQAGLTAATKWTAHGWGPHTLVEREWDSSAPPAEKGRLFVNPSYVPYFLAARFLEDHEASVQVANNGVAGPRLWILATQDGSSKAAILLVNPTTQDVPVRFHLTGSAGSLCVESLSLVRASAPGPDERRSVVLNGVDQVDLNQVIFDRLNTGTSRENVLSLQDVTGAVATADEPVSACDPEIVVPAYTMEAVILRTADEPREPTDALPPEPADVSGRLLSGGEVEFSWHWTRDRAQDGLSPVGYCTAEGHASGQPDVPCDPGTNGPFWWRVVQDPDGPAPQVVAYWFTSSDTSLPHMSPGATRLRVSCAGREGHSLQVQVITRDALGNMAPGEVAAAEVTCPYADLPDTVPPLPPDLRAAYDGLRGALRFSWAWTQDLAPEGGMPVGYCTEQGRASRQPDLECDPAVTGPYWWQVVDVTDPSNRHRIAFYYNGQNTDQADATPFTDSYLAPCGTSLPARVYRLDAAARDAAGNKSEYVNIRQSCPEDTLPPLPPRITVAEIRDDGRGGRSAHFDWQWVGDRAPDGATAVGFCTSSGQAFADPTVACDQDLAGPFWWEVWDVTSNTRVAYFHDSGDRDCSSSIGPGSHSVSISCQGRAGHAVELRVASRDALGNFRPDEASTARLTCP